MQKFKGDKKVTNHIRFMVDQILQSMDSLMGNYCSKYEFGSHQIPSTFMDICGIYCDKIDTSYLVYCGR